METDRLTAVAMGSISDQMARDGKGNRSNLIVDVPLAVLLVIVAAPLWLFVLLPLALISITASLFWVSIVGKKALPKPRPITSADTASTSSTPRQFDLVVYGATGFTGQLAVNYLGKNYSKSLKWALAGRNREALVKIKEKFNLPDEVEIIIADAADGEALTSMVKRTKVVISTAGPFLLHGSELVRSCAIQGTHYCDITGEVDWVRKMIDLYDEAAKKSGACIVNLCGHDSVPWDLAVFSLSKCLKELKNNESLARVHLFNDISASASGGTLATVFAAIENRSNEKSSLGFDPLLKTKDTGSKDTSSYSIKNQSVLGYSAIAKKWMGPFVMASVNANCVRRSNTLLKYSTKLSYAEAQVFPDFFSAFNAQMFFLLFATAIACYPLRWLLLQLGVVPSPGAGPSVAQMDAGFLKVTAFGEGVNGSKVKCEVYFPTDPGYRDTARMLVESGLVLALRDNAGWNGFHSPASALGTTLIERLCASGSSFKCGLE